MKIYFIIIAMFLGFSSQAQTKDTCACKQPTFRFVPTIGQPDLIFIKRNRTNTTIGYYDRVFKEFKFNDEDLITTEELEELLAEAKKRDK